MAQRALNLSAHAATSNNSRLGQLIVSPVSLRQASAASHSELASDAASTRNVTLLVARSPLLDDCQKEQRALRPWRTSSNL